MEVAAGAQHHERSCPGERDGFASDRRRTHNDGVRVLAEQSQHFPVGTTTEAFGGPGIIHRIPGRVGHHDGSHTLGPHRGGVPEEVTLAFLTREVIDLGGRGNDPVQIH